MNHDEPNHAGMPLHVVLRQRRQQLRLLQNEIAEQLRITPECVGMWESGRRRISLDKLPRLATVLQLNQREFCSEALREFHPAFHAALFAGEPLAASPV